MGPVLLGISVVTYKLDADQFEQVLRHLHAAIRWFEQSHPASVQLCIIDNGNDAAGLHRLLTATGLAESTLISPGRNLGYGRAHNRAITAATSRYHLIMNPDVLVAQDALLQAVNFLEAHPDVAALSPHAVDAEGQAAYLCKRYPAVLDLALRGFAPATLKQRFSTRLGHYEHRSLAAQNAAAEVDLISGCFMFCRTQALKNAGGFNPAFFLYFEDFALSLELKKQGRMMYCPDCRIVHYGGNAGKKGVRHILHFIASALRFYNQYGWKLL